MVLRHRAVLEHDLAVVHEAPAERLVAARHREARRVARHEEARGALGHARPGLGRGVDDVELGVVAVGDELLAAVDHPLVASSARRGCASSLRARRRAASGRRRRAARSGSAPAGSRVLRPRAGTISPAGGAARRCAAAPRPSRSAPACRRGRSRRARSPRRSPRRSAPRSRVERGAAELLGDAERADADLVGRLRGCFAAGAPPASCSIRAASSGG